MSNKQNVKKKRDRFINKVISHFRDALLPGNTVVDAGKKILDDLLFAIENKTIISSDHFKREDCGKVVVYSLTLEFDIHEISLFYTFEVTDSGLMPQMQYLGVESNPKEYNHVDQESELYKILDNVISKKWIDSKTKRSQMIEEIKKRMTSILQNESQEDIKEPIQPPITKT